MTTDVFNPRTATPAEDRNERAQRAVRAFRAMQPGLTGYARAITGRKDIRVVLDKGNTRTDGKSIFFCPPIELGDYTPHVRTDCDRRDPETFKQVCKACRVRETVLIQIYHEIAHNLYGTFDEPHDIQKQDVIEKALEFSGSRYAKRIEKEWHALDFKQKDHINLSGLISPFLPMLVNVLEDVRVDEAMFKARKGTRVMFNALTQGIFREGVELPDGSKSLWSERPLNSQILIGVFALGCRYRYEGWFAPEIEEALADPELRTLVDKADTLTKPIQTYELSFLILARLRDLGFLLAPEEPDDPEPDTQENEENEENDDEATEDEDDSEPDSSGTGDSSDDPADTEGDSGEDEESGEEASDSGDEGHADGADEGSRRPDEAGGEPEGEADGASDADSDSDAEGGSDPQSGGDEGGNGGGEEGSDSGPVGEGDPGDDSGVSDDELDGQSGGSESSGQPGESERAGEAEGTADPSAEGSSDGSDDSSSGVPDGGSGEELTDDEPVDTGADKGEGGTELEGKLPRGTPEDAFADVQVSGGHEQTPRHAQVTGEEEAEQKAVQRAVMQGEYFEKPSTHVMGVREHKWGHPIYEGGYNISVGWGDSQDGLRRNRRRSGTDADTDIPESVLGPALIEMRRVLSDNARAKHERHLRSGKINKRVLGKRAWGGDDRLFQKKRIPGRKSYAVIIGIDISGSTYGVNLALAKRAAMAQAELCQRAGVEFAIYAHTALADYTPGASAGLMLDVYEIKSFDAPWNPTTKEALGAITSSADNLDGHTIEYYRKVIERHPATDKIILYYTDGKMPAANHDEELEILVREIKYCKAKNITLLGVGIRTDSPRRHGLDTVEVETDEDVSKVVRHLQSALLHNR